LLPALYSGKTPAMPGREKLCQLAGGQLLNDSHTELDAAVLTAYGFSAKRICSPNSYPEPGSRRED
jgi:hypothetical protein